jgi:hypothetical protein
LCRREFAGDFAGAEQEQRCRGGAEQVQVNAGAGAEVKSEVALLEVQSCIGAYY